MLTAVAVFVAATITIILGLATTSPASAEGLNFVCSAADEGGGPGEFESLRNGLAVAIVTGNSFFIFRGLAPPGVPVDGGEVVHLAGLGAVR